MNTKQTVANRIVALCEQKGVAINAIANTSGVPPMTVYSILNSKSRNPGIVTIKKLCDGLEVTLGEFFSTPEFDALEQEIK
ncbi:MAG: helix-turn-helix domain-containing protein [Oscillospiraceae bacterium]|nr:helix-turn-helix domain-containing protein [Oscillospiraceae bacterium]